MSHLEILIDYSHMVLNFKHQADIGHGIGGFHESHESNGGTPSLLLPGTFAHAIHPCVTHSFFKLLW